MVWLNPILEFHKKISTYDRANWEVIVEKQKATHASNNNLACNTTQNHFESRKNELIDVDLILGTTFTKAKPTYHFGTVSIRSFFQIIFFPFYYRWWTINLSYQCYMVFLTVYLGFIVNICLCTSLLHYQFYDDAIGMLISTFLIILILGELFVHVVSTNLTKPKNKKKVTHLLSVHSKKEELTNDIRAMSITHDTDAILLCDSVTTNTVYKNRCNKSSVSAKSRMVSTTRSSSADQARVLSIGDNSFADNMFNKCSIINDETTNPSYDENNFLKFNKPSTKLHANFQRDIDLSGHVTCSSSSISDTENTNLQNEIFISNEKIQNKHINHEMKSNAISQSKDEEYVFNDNSNPSQTFTMQTNSITVDDNVIISNMNDITEQTYTKNIKMDPINNKSTNIDTTTCNISEILQPRYSSGDRICRNTNYPFFKNNDYRSKESFYEYGNVKAPFKDQITVTLFDDNGDQFRAKLSLLELSAYIDERVKIKDINATKTLYTCFLLATFVALLPIVFHVFSPILSSPSNISELLSRIHNWRFHINTWYINISLEYMLFIMIIIYIRFATSAALFFLLAVAERALKVKYVYAKYFTALTSWRRAKRNRLPHFRLHKVRNIKAWLSLRSYIKRSGPVRSVELIMSVTLFLSVLLIVVLCYNLLSIVGENSTNNADAINKFSEFCTWDISLWGLALTYYLMCFLSVSFNINKKFQNHSELITEQINLYLKMEQNVDKKENLTICNNVLKLASKLLKDLEPPKKVTMLLINPFFVNILRVVFLSFLSALISEIFGIRFKLWKIKA